MKPLILITNDDGVTAKGLRALDEVAMEFGDVVVMAPEYNASGLSHSITSSRPLWLINHPHRERRPMVECCSDSGSLS